MKIKIICVGKIKENSLKNLINEYTKQIKDLTIFEVKDEKNQLGLKLEAKRILKHLNKNEYTIGLVIKGNEHNSLSLAKLFDHIQTNLNKPITFIIGGSYGLDNSVLETLDYKLSLSKLTFPHQLTRLILVEQIYRSLMILNNHPYHK
ncbi:MAG: 23S rRNA (pseudouridine(1915)-N(3))-methyltransferase RlmH [Acholeplasmataceae bacterium]